MASAFIDSSLPASITPAADLAYSTDNLKNVSPFYKGIVGDDRSGQLETPEINISEAVNGPLLPGYYKLPDSHNVPAYFIEFDSGNTLNGSKLTRDRSEMLGYQDWSDNTCFVLNNSKEMFSNEQRALADDLVKHDIIRYDNDGGYKESHPGAIFVAVAADDGILRDTALHEINHTYYSRDPEYKEWVNRIWDSQSSDFQEYAGRVYSRIDPSNTGAPAEFAATFSNLHGAEEHNPIVRTDVERGWQPLIDANTSLRAALPTDLKPFYSSIN